MKRDIEAYKEYIRTLVGETYWASPPALYLFQREYMTREGALLFALEHCQFTDKFPRWFGNIVANCPFIDARAYMIENMFVEEVKDPTIEVGHNESMWVFARALGADEQQIRNYVPLIVTTMALHYFDNVSRTKPWLEAFAAIGVFELLTNAPLAARYGQIPGNSSKPWAKLGLDRSAMSHWSAAEHADHGVGDDGPGHGEDALALLARYAVTEEEQERAAEALRESILVHKHQYDEIGRRAIELAKV
ncbi:MAG TPA: iron-containing redox enzyme family protein [Candidatus Lustribacter sp.]|nr:iron-containing redox enzyme family protein [Candidatus Lustribacter sp.]